MKIYHLIFHNDSKRKTKDGEQIWKNERNSSIFENIAYLYNIQQFLFHTKPRFPRAISPLSSSNFKERRVLFSLFLTLRDKAELLRLARISHLLPSFSLIHPVNNGKRWQNAWPPLLTRVSPFLPSPFFFFFSFFFCSFDSLSIKPLLFSEPDKAIPWMVGAKLLRYRCLVIVNFAGFSTISLLHRESFFF